MAETDSEIEIDQAMEGERFVPNGFINPCPGLPVLKVGRTTGLTTGLINGINIALQGMPFDSPSGRKFARFEEIFSVTPIIGTFPFPPFAEQGDSGSLIVDHMGVHGVGLLFAISSPKNLSFGCSLSRISSAFGVEL